MNRRPILLFSATVMSAYVVAQPLPTMPPPGYDQPGRYPAGTVQWNVSYYSSVAGSNLTMHVYLPPNYNTNQKYAVIYCYQGIGVGPDTIFASWNVYANVVADNLIGEGKIKPVIIVALDDQFAGTRSDVAGMTLNDAIPFVESRYSTYGDAAHRGIYGYSWGGGYAFNVGCANLDTFQHLAPSSAAPNKAADSTLFPNGGAEAKQKLKTLLIACGTADSLYSASEAAHNYCVPNNIPHAWWPINGAGHWAGEVWRPHFWNFLLMADAAGISDPPIPRSAYTQNEAEDYDQRRGVTPETCSEGGKNIGFIQNGSYVTYNNVDFGTGPTNFQARVASATSGGNIEIRLGGTNGTLIGTCVVPNTGGWQTWTTVSCTVTNVPGIHNLCLRFTGGSGYLFNINWWKFGGPISPVLPPAAPSNVTSTSNIERVTLRWSAVPNATSYRIKRSTTSGGPYSTIASVAGTNYNDTSVVGGTTYYYVVSALNLGGESLPSAEVSATPKVNVPSPWLTQDIGPVGLSGGTMFSNGVFTVIASGSDIAQTADAFRFVHLPATGDCTIIARVASLENHISPWSKAGLMIRQSLTSNAPNVFIGVTPRNGVVWQYRLTTGGNTATANAAGPTTPCWLKLSRNGNTYAGYYSADGTNWTQLGSVTFAMPTSTYVGLALSSHNLYTLCGATFDHVSGPNWTPVYPTTPASVQATGDIEQVRLTWTSSSNSTCYYVKRATTSGGPYTTIAVVTTTNYTDRAVIARTTYYYVVSAVNELAGESPDSLEVSATPLSGVPLPWTSRDIGTVGLPGSAIYTNGAFTVIGSGDDIWNTADAFRFVYIVTNSTNFSITARVVSIQNVNPWSKAGVMIRQSLDPGAVNALVAVTPGNGVTFQYRSSPGGGCNFINVTGISAPYWVRLVRNGDTFTAYRSPNGISWNTLGSVVLTNISTAYVGLAVTAHNNSALCTAKFDNVSLPGWPPPLIQVTPIAVSSVQINLTWNTVPGAASYTIKRATNRAGPYVILTSGLTTTNWTDYVTSVTQGYYYVVSALVGGMETNSPEAAVQFPKLTGRIIGTPGSWNNSGNTIEKVFDNDLTTFFDAPDPGNGDWVGLDFGLGVSNVITKINYCPRAGFESRMIGGVFQGANRPDFSDAVTLGRVSAAPPAGVFTELIVTNPSAFRYVRYLAPDASWGNVAELEFYGYLSYSPPPPIVKIEVDKTNVFLTWPGVNVGYRLQYRTNLTQGQWQDLPAVEPTLRQEKWNVTLPLSNHDSIFYRIVR